MLGGWSRDVDLTMRKLFGSRGYDVLRRMQKATISSSLNIVSTSKLPSIEFPLGNSVEAPYSFCIGERLYFKRFLYFISIFFFNYKQFSFYSSLRSHRLRCVVMWFYFSLHTFFNCT